MHVITYMAHASCRLLPLAATPTEHQSPRGQPMEGEGGPNPITTQSGTLFLGRVGTPRGKRNSENPPSQHNQAIISEKNLSKQRWRPAKNPARQTRCCPCWCWHDRPPKIEIFETRQKKGHPSPPRNDCGTGPATPPGTSGERQQK